MRDGKPVRYRNSASMPLWKLRNWDEMSYTVSERKNMAEGKAVFLDDVDILPTYNGSTVVNMYKDVMKLANENLPDAARSDSRENVKISFSLGTDCSISNIDVVESPNDRYSEAATNAVKSLTGRWSAAELYGEKVVVKMNVLIPFPVKSELGKAGSAISKDGQTMAKFGDGGLKEFRSWVLMNIKYPVEVAKEKIEGRVVIEFMVEMDGSIKQTNVMQSPDVRLSNEVMRVVKSSPKWSPATKDGKPVRIKYIIPVDFRFQ
ncbi:MAG: energy transducer TonB [Rikenellaceae bacterium]